MDNLRVTIVQAKLVWEQPHKNIAHFTDLLNDVQSGDTDLIVLPEMFNTGFSMNATLLAEQTGGPSMKFLAHLAQEKDCAVTASLIIEEKGKFFNRMIWMLSDGTYEVYNKRHLFRLAQEETVFAAGNERVVVKYKGWRILLQVCYDLRFPVWSRNCNDYDAVLYIANWPERRSFAWRSLLTARAIENLAYVVGVNRVGKDGNEVIHSGDSAIIDAKGEYVLQCKPGEEGVHTATLSMKDLLDFREVFPAGMDADKFSIHI